MEHVLVLSEHIDATRDFYSRVVGLTVGERPPLPFPGYWLYAGGIPCLHVAERSSYLVHAQGLGLGEPAPPAAAAVDHIAFSAGDYDSVRARLEQAGVGAVVNTVAGGELRQLFFQDPNGVRLEINVKGPVASVGQVPRGSS
jgi:catechol 2,3-dioxygenase-like lactoylglutathione lyase family enzyme